MCQVKWTEYLSEVEPKSRRWLWPQRIPLGEITLLAGIQGMGKSLLTACIAGHVTTGKAWPDNTHCETGSVILLQAEDSIANTIQPRFTAAGANLSKVRIITGVLNKNKSDLLPFDLAADIPQLIWTIKNTPEVKLIIIDPIGSYIGGIDIHRENQVRSIMYRLKMHIAEKYGVALLIVVHLRKGGGEDPVLSRVLGSVAFTGAARTVWGVAHSVDDPDLRFFVPMKHNLTSSRATGWEFSISSAANGEGVCNWEKQCDRIAEEVMVDHGMKAQSQVDKAMDLIQTALQAGPQPASKIKEIMVLENISWRTANKAKTELKIRSAKDGNQWIWSLFEGVK